MVFRWLSRNKRTARSPFQIQQDFFSNCEISEIADFRERLANLPFMSENSFGTTHCTGAPETLIENVPIKNIIGTTSDRTWNFADRNLPDISNEEYVWDLSKKIKLGAVNVLDEYPDIYLNGIGNTYFVFSNGRHRIAAIKGMLGSDELLIKANVTRRSNYVLRTKARVEHVNYQNKKILFNSDDLKPENFCVSPLIFFEERRRNGLWNGNLKRAYYGPEINNPERFCFYTEWEILEMKGPWVFASDLRMAEEMFLKFNPDLKETKSNDSFHNKTPGRA